MEKCLNCGSTRIVGYGYVYVGECRPMDATRNIKYIACSDCGYIMLSGNLKRIKEQYDFSLKIKNEIEELTKAIKEQLDEINIIKLNIEKTTKEINDMQEKVQDENITIRNQKELLSIIKEKNNEINIMKNKIIGIECIIRTNQNALLERRTKLPDLLT